MLVLYTDFGVSGPYVGQMKAVVLGVDPAMPVVDLMHDAPPFNPRASAYLLAALMDCLPVAPATADVVVLGVVDPGVGTDRRAIVVRADGRWYVGPDNGLFALVHRRAREVSAWEIVWRPSTLSASFHGRDLFAPVAAAVAHEGRTAVDRFCRAVDPMALVGGDWPDDLDEIIYVDAYGNAMTGIRGEKVSPNDAVLVHNLAITYKKTFAEGGATEAFWYVNSAGLLEIASPCSPAAERHRLTVGTSVEIGRETKL